MHLSKLILPNDITAESGVIATLIENPEMCLCYEQLKPNHFFKPENQALYWSITDLYKNGIEQIDKYNITLKLGEWKTLQKYIDNVGGDSFVGTVIENAPYASRDSEDEYKISARKVLECAFRRELYNENQKFIPRILNTENNLNELNTKMITSMDDIAERFVAGENIQLFANRVDSVIAQIDEDRKRSADGIVGMKPHWKPLADLIRYEDGEAYAFMARRKVGKSLILLTEGLEKSKQGESVIMTSTEMDDKKEMFRMLAILSGLPIDDIKAGRFSNHTNGYQRYKEAIATLKEIKFTREYHPQWTKEMLVTKCKAVKHKMGGCSLIIHDYIKDQESLDSSTQYNNLGLWADTLKNQIAGSFGVPVLTAVQLNRSGAIGDSDKIERYLSAGIKWEKKSMEEIMDHGSNCGNHKMSIVFSRDGGAHDEDDFIDFYLDTRKNHANLRILEAREQHSDNLVPDFMKESDDE